MSDPYDPADLPEPPPGAVSYRFDDPAGEAAFARLCAGGYDDPDDDEPGDEDYGDDDPGPGFGAGHFRGDPAPDLSRAPARAGAPSPRERHDAFTEARKSRFLEALIKTGCVKEAAGRVGVSARTIYRHQEADPRFLEHCAAALRMAATPLELTAWQRAVEGVEQEFACGGQVHVRRRYDGSLLRLLLQGSNPKKYGARPGFKRKRLLREERKQLEREVRAEFAASQKASKDDLADALLAKLDVLDRRKAPKRLDAGWTRAADGTWVPPGYAPIPGWLPPPAEPDGEEPPGESM